MNVHNINSGYSADLCVVGAGRIGLPWAAVLADEGFEVVCVDVDRGLVEDINEGIAPFEETGLAELLHRTVEAGSLSATTAANAVGDAAVVGLTLNAPISKLEWYIGVVEEYASYMTPDQTVVNRTTLPVPTISKIRSELAGSMGLEADEMRYVTFPERLAEGRAVREIRTLPKLIGTHGRGEAAIAELIDPLDGEAKFTDHESAMFAKLVDNAYRDARFAIANQFALLADDLGLDGNHVIDLANEDYPRNDIPSPGMVGGKCLTKDPHFLTREHVGFSKETPDLFATTRAVNEAFISRVVDQVLRYEPASVALLGTAFKRNVSDEVKSPSMKIRSSLQEQNVEVDYFDPYAGRGQSIAQTVEGTDVVVIAVNHSYFEERSDEIRSLTRNKDVVDVWGILS